LIDERAYKLGMLRQMRHDLFAGHAEGLLSYLAQDDEIDSTLRERIEHMSRNGTHA
jgi:hypothetical protein